MTQALVQEIEKEAIWLRSLLLPQWQSWHAERQGWAKQGGAPHSPTCDSDGMCRFTVFAALSLFEDESLQDWEVVGGEPIDGGPGGFRMPSGEWRGHYWLRTGRFILDITADQFGESEVVVTDRDDPRYRSNYTQEELREHEGQVSRTVAGWLDTIQSSSTTPVYP